MSKVTGPLLSFSAGGKIANTQVYSKWRGIPYVRRYVVPGNPKTSGQELTRNTFRWAAGAWVWMPAIGQEPWTAYAVGRAFTDRNAWMSRAISQLRGETTLNLLEGSPGVRGGLPPASMTATGGANSIAVTFSVPDIPPGWTLTASQAICIPQQNPQTDFAGPLTAQQATATPWTINFTGLEAATPYVVAGWLKWDRGGGGAAYSISLNDQATTS